MSRRTEGQLFVGRLSKDVRTRDLEDVFELYGRLARCEIKYGAEMAYAFVDYEDRRDADDAVKYENGREIRGSSIIVEWAKGAPRRPLGYDECYKCHRPGHWARDCPEDRFGFRRRGRSRSPRRRSRRSRSRSRSRDRRSRRKSRSRSRSRSRDRKRSRKSPSRSKSRSRSRSRQRSGSKSPRRHRSPSKSPRRSPSRSPRENGNGTDGSPDPSGED